MPDSVRQLPLDLPVRAARGRTAFLVAGPNARAVAEIDRWRDWPGGKLALAGPAGAGKSHLAAIWAAETGARRLAGDALPEAAGLAGASVLVDEADAVPGCATSEARLLHLHNHVLGGGGRLLLVGRTPPARWAVALPDLASRLRATHVATIAAPDDVLLTAVMGKLFEDRGVAVAPDVVSYCVARMERSFAEAERVVAALDARALAAGRRIGKRLAAEVLAEAG